MTANERLERAKKSGAALRLAERIATLKEQYDAPNASDWRKKVDRAK